MQRWYGGVLGDCERGRRALGCAASRLRGLSSNGDVQSREDESGLVVRLFPRTPHLWWSGFRGRDDLQLSTEESESFLRGVVVVQEKLDGANISFTVSDGRVVVENRGKPVSSHPQFDLLKRWAAEHEESLRSLGSRVVFGEWLLAEHGTRYDRLPDWFVAYDVYDPREDRFLPWQEVELTCRALGLALVPVLPWTARDGQDGLLRLAGQVSAFSAAGLREGVYCRHEDEHRVLARAKLVRPGYVPRSDEDWRTRGLIKNRRQKEP